MPVFTPELLARHAATIEQPAPAPTSNQDGRSLYRKTGLPAVIGGNVADIATTLQAIHEGRAREANPLIGSGTGRMVATKAMTTAAEALLFDLLAKHHSKAAILSALGVGALETGLAVRNAKIGR